MAAQQQDQCPTCQRTVVTSAIQCDLCDKWIHRLCAGLSLKELVHRSSNVFSFLCYHCRSCFPFECLNDDELYRELFLARNQSDLQYLNRTHPPLVTGLERHISYPLTVLPITYEGPGNNS